MSISVNVPDICFRESAAMNGIQSSQIGQHKIKMDLRDDVGPISPYYSLLLAENIPDLTGQTVVDVGSGSGFLSIVAKLQGASAYTCSIRMKAPLHWRWKMQSTIAFERA
jgi:predicted nicotinamide N-methyase